MYCIYPDELYHHGIKGQKWGIRRYQNEDGSLTTAGKKGYSTGELRTMSKQVGEYNVGKLAIRNKGINERNKINDWYNSEDAKLFKNKSKVSQKDIDKAYDKLGKEFDRRFNESYKKQGERENALAKELTKKYGIDLNVSMKEIQKGSAPYRLAASYISDMFKKKNKLKVPDVWNERPTAPSSTWDEKHRNPRKGGNI